MKLALSIPILRRITIKEGRDRECKGLDGDVNSQPDRLKKRKPGREGKMGYVGKWSWTNMKQRETEDAG